MKKTTSKERWRGMGHDKTITDEYSHKMTILLTENQYRKLIKAMEDEGFSILSEYIRVIVLQYTRRALQDRWRV